MKKRVDYGKVAFVLAVLIVLIFAFDFARRALIGLFGHPSGLIAGSASSVSDSTADNPVASTDASAPAGEDSQAGTEPAASPDGGYDAALYQTVSKPYADVSNGPLVLVNKEHAYQGATGSTVLTGFQNLKNECYRLKNFDLLVRADVIDPLNSLFKDFNANSGLKNVMLYSTHETNAGGMYAPAIPERAAGYSVDLSVLNDDGSLAAFTGEGKYNWITTNCGTYGFIQRYPADKESVTGIAGAPWHLRYVGVAHAALMKELNLCLEEYIDMLRERTVSGTHASVTAAGVAYDIYYVPATPNGNTEVPVPKTGTYTISGNNVDGFIVTTQPAG